MMHWVMPAMMLGMALGSSTFHNSCQRVAPKASPASSRGLGTEAMPSVVSRIGAGKAKMTVEISPGTTPRPNRISVGIRYTKVGMVCIRSSSGRSPAASQGRCAAAMPSGTPSSTQVRVAHSTSARVSSVSSQ